MSERRPIQVEGTVRVKTKGWKNVILDDEHEGTKHGGGACHRTGEVTWSFGACPVSSYGLLWGDGGLADKTDLPKVRLWLCRHWIQAAQH